jgi:manganese transport protein
VTELPASLRRSTLLLGPAFVAGIAYVDPGNVATNTTAGAKFGYLLVWVIVVANITAMLVQYLSAKLGIATGMSLPRACRERYGTRARVGLWLQAEVVAMATDLAEILGGAVALQLLFDVPLLVGGVTVAAVSFALLALQGRRQFAFERLIIVFLAVIAVGFGWPALAAEPDPGGVARGLVPQLEGTESLLLATAMLGATVMPHAIYLHSALIVDRFGGEAEGRPTRAQLLQVTKMDVRLSMAIAGAINLAMVLLAAAALQGSGSETLEGVHRGVELGLGGLAATMFALGLLASGFASTSVGTYAGAVILEGFTGQRVPLVLRRLLTVVPALAILSAGVEPTTALVISQVVLSFGIPFAMFPLLALTNDRYVMGELANRRQTAVAGWIAAVAISALNAALIVLTLT